MKLPWNRRERTPREKANRAQTNIAMRLIGCGILIYIIVQLFREESAAELGVWRVVILVAFILLAAGVIALTLFDFIRNLKTGYYSVSTYYADEAENAEAETTAEALPEAIEAAEPDASAPEDIEP